MDIAFLFIHIIAVRGNSHRVQKVVDLSLSMITWVFDQQQL